MFEINNFDFDDLFRLTFKSWNRPVKEVNGYTIIDTKEGKLIVVNALGINKDDLKVSVVGNTLLIRGETEAKEINFTNSINFTFGIEGLKPMLEGIEYELKNGLAYITLKIKKEKEKEIKISYKRPEEIVMERLENIANS